MRLPALLFALAAALATPGVARATEVSLPMDDGTLIVASLLEPKWLTADRRSGGFASLDGPREVADVRSELQWFAGLPEVSDTQIGACGISLGGGAVWNASSPAFPSARSRAWRRGAICTRPCIRRTS